MYELETAEEYEAWDVLMASVGQFRYAPSGQIIGLDFTFCLELARARNYNAKAVSEFLQDAEPTILSLVNELFEE